MYSTFSVLMSVYKNENPNFLEESIQSILNNTQPPSQIVIVKDGLLTPELDSILDTYGNKPIFTIVGYEENKGLGFALNYGLSFCSNDLVARMDSDDVCDKDRFIKQLNIFNTNPSLSIVGGNVSEFIDDIKNVLSRRVVPETNDLIRNYSKFRNPYNHPTVMFKKKDVMLAGGYLHLFRHEDYYLWYRMIKAGMLGYNIQSSLVFMRISRDFYKRRGGRKAFSARNKLNGIMYKDGFISFIQFLKVFFLNFGNLICPSLLRKIVHKKYLRKSD